jgi:hypothetical protein
MSRSIAASIPSRDYECNTCRDRTADGLVQPAIAAGAFSSVTPEAHVGYFDRARVGSNPIDAADDA